MVVLAWNGPKPRVCITMLILFSIEKYKAAAMLIFIPQNRDK